jgi:hypothetical protein
VHAPRARSANIKKYGPSTQIPEDGLAGRVQFSRQLPGEAAEPFPEALIGEGRTAYPLLQPLLAWQAALAGPSLTKQFQPLLFRHPDRIVYLDLHFSAAKDVGN